MKSAWQLSLVALAAGALSVSVWAQGTDFSKIEFTAKKVTSNLYMVSGSPKVDVNHPDAAGGLVGVLAGPDGIFMVDAQYAQVSDKLLATIRKISPEPIRFMANTHIHPDHTAGNPFFGKMGVVIFAREELRDQMIRPPRAGNGNPGPARDSAGYPVVTYGMGAPVTLHMNGEVIDLIPVRAAHTGGDTHGRMGCENRRRPRGCRRRSDKCRPVCQRGLSGAEGGSPIELGVMNVLPIAFAMMLMILGGPQAQPQRSSASIEGVVVKLG